MPARKIEWRSIRRDLEVTREAMRQARQAGSGAIARFVGDEPARQATGPALPRPDLSAASDGGTTDAAACWARLVRAWLLPSNELETIELSVEDLHSAFLEIFSAGGVHHVEQTRKFIDLLGDAPDKAWLLPTPGESRFVSAGDEPDTELE
jgi:hypothetical protein